VTLRDDLLIEADDLLAGRDAVIVDCRFSLADPLEGSRLYQTGHIPGAHYLDLNQDLSSPVQQQGGRHPLPDPLLLAERLAVCGIGPTTSVIAYDDTRLAYASRLWWLMRSMGYCQPKLLNGGYRAWLEAGGVPAVGEIAVSKVATGGGSLTGFCDIDGLRALQSEGCTLVDSREERRYRGLEEPIDPVAGHIPGAVNHPWQSVTDQQGRVLSEQELRVHWGESLEAESLVIYCGSGVTACVNLFSLALLGRDDPVLYAGSWSDWCSRL
jgi:thiosulfate/3-mercaptopyruvate sulfurtransferase